MIAAFVWYKKENNDQVANSSANDTPDNTDHTDSDYPDNTGATNDDNSAGNNTGCDSDGSNFGGGNSGICNSRGSNTGDSNFGSYKPFGKQTSIDSSQRNTASGSYGESNQACATNQVSYSSAVVTPEITAQKAQDVGSEKQVKFDEVISSRTTPGSHDLSQSKEKDFTEEERQQAAKALGNRNQQEQEGKPCELKEAQMQYQEQAKREGSAELEKTFLAQEDLNETVEAFFEEFKKFLSYESDIVGKINICRECAKNINTLLEPIQETELRRTLRQDLEQKCLNEAARHYEELLIANFKVLPEDVPTSIKVRLRLDDFLRCQVNTECKENFSIKLLKATINFIINEVFTEESSSEETLDNKFEKANQSLEWLMLDRDMKKYARAQLNEKMMEQHDFDVVTNPYNNTYLVQVGDYPPWSDRRSDDGAWLRFASNAAKRKANAGDPVDLRLRGIHKYDWYSYLEFRGKVPTVRGYYSVSWENKLIAWYDDLLLRGNGPIFWYNDYFYANFLHVLPDEQRWKVLEVWYKNNGPELLTEEEKDYFEAKEARRNMKIFKEVACMLMPNEILEHIGSFTKAGVSSITGT